MDMTELDINRTLLQNNALFSGVSADDLDEILSLTTERVFSPQDFIIREEEPGEEEFYIIKAGEVEIIKYSANSEEKIFYRITTLTVGETIGEVALLEESKRTASARALMETTVLVLPINALREMSTHQKHYAGIINQLKILQDELAKPPSYEKMALNLAKGLSQRLYNTNAITAEALQHELMLSRLRVTTGRFLILAISVMVIYTYCLSVISAMAAYLPSTTIVAIPLLFFFSSVIIYFMVTSGYPMSFFGLTLKNWRKSALQGVLWTIPVLALIVLIKWISIQMFQNHLPLFEGPPNMDKLSFMMVIVLIAAYLTLTPLQELLVRGVIQSSLQHFLTGKHRVLAAIVVSNLIFGMTHLHVSLVMAISVLVFGFFWGWMYARQGNLVGVSISHLLVGGWGFFVVGVESILFR